MTLLRRHIVQWPSDIELVGATAFLMRAAWMLYPDWQSIPLEVQGYLIPDWFTEAQWGMVLLILALLQVTLASFRRGHLGRALVATAAALVQGMACLGYWQAGYFYRGVVPLVLVVIWIEMVIAARGWRDWLASKQQASAWT
jgi:hypothetical protein